MRAVFRLHHLALLLVDGRVLRLLRVRLLHGLHLDVRRRGRRRGRQDDRHRRSSRADRAELGGAPRREHKLLAVRRRERGRGRGRRRELLLLGRGRPLGHLAAALLERPLVDRQLHQQLRGALAAALGPEARLARLALLDRRERLLLGLASRLRDGALAGVGGRVEGFDPLGVLVELAHQVPRLVLARFLAVVHQVGVLARHEKRQVARLFPRLVVAAIGGEVGLLALADHDDGRLHFEEALLVLALRQVAVGRQPQVRKLGARVLEQLVQRGLPRRAGCGVALDALNLIERHVHTGGVVVLRADHEAAEPVAVLQELHPKVGDVVAPAGALEPRAVVPVDPLDDPAHEPERAQLIVQLGGDVPAPLVVQVHLLRRLREAALVVARRALARLAEGAARQAARGSQCGEGHHDFAAVCSVCRFSGLCGFLGGAGAVFGGSGRGFRGQRFLGG